MNNRRNEILTGFSTLEGHSTQGLYVTAVYYLKNPGLAAEEDGQADSLVDQQSQGRYREGSVYYGKNG